MTLPVVLRPEARNDFIAARNWYEQQRLGLGRSFSDSVQELLANIKDHPEL